MNNLNKIQLIILFLLALTACNNKEKNIHNKSEGVYKKDSLVQIPLFQINSLEFMKGPIHALKLAVDSKKHFAIGNAFDNRIRIFDSLGRKIDQIKLPVKEVLRKMCYNDDNDSLIIATEDEDLLYIYKDHVLRSIKYARPEDWLTSVYISFRNNNDYFIGMYRLSSAIQNDFIDTTRFPYFTNVSFNREERYVYQMLNDVLIRYNLDGPDRNFLYYILNGASESKVLYVNMSKDNLVYFDGQNSLFTLNTKTRALRRTFYFDCWDKVYNDFCCNSDMTKFWGISSFVYNRITVSEWRHFGK